MRFATVRIDGRQTWGICTDEGFADLGTEMSEVASLRDVIGAGLLRELASSVPSASVDLDELEFLPVIPDSRQIFCVGMNYEEHRRETGGDGTVQPTIFLRLSGSQIGHGQPLLKPRESDRFDYEGELAVVIGKGGRRIAEQHAFEHIAGYSCYQDASVRDWQKHTSQWIPGKNFVGTGGFGPYLVTPDEVPNLAESVLVTTVNGEQRQRARIGDMTASIAEVIAYVSTFAALLPGDVIATGTPGGIGSRRTPPTFLADGDVVEVSIDGVGTLRNPVVAET